MKNTAVTTHVLIFYDIIVRHAKKGGDRKNHGSSGEREA